MRTWGMLGFLWMVQAIAAPAASAVEFRRWGIGIVGGVAAPTGAYADILAVGGVVEATGEYFVSPAVSLGLAGGVVFQSPKPEYSPPDLETTARLYEVLLFARYTAPGDGTRVFGDLSLGGVNRKLVIQDPFENSTEVLDEQRTRLGVAGGLGLFVPIGTTAELLPEIQYLWVPLSEDEVLGASSQNSFLGKLALRFRFGD